MMTMGIPNTHKKKRNERELNCETQPEELWGELDAKTMIDVKQVAASDAELEIRDWR